MRSEPYRLRIVLPLQPTNAAANLTWKQKMGQTVKLRRLVADQLWGRIPKEPLGFAHLTCTRHSTQQPDFENLAHGFKAAIDLLRASVIGGKVGYGIILDDDPDHCTREYHWCKAPRGDGSMVIEVLEIAREAIEAERVELDTGTGEI